jgi:hypothetical protein
VSLDVAMEQERARVDDLIAQSHPGAVPFSGGCGVLLAVHVSTYGHAGRRAERRG